MSHGDYRTFIESEMPETRRPGDFIDNNGRYLGRHDGAACERTRRADRRAPARPLRALGHMRKPRALEVAVAVETRRERRKWP